MDEDLGAFPAPTRATAAPTSVPVTFSTFASTLRPQAMTVPNLARPGTTRQEIVPGSADEVYLRLVRIRHGSEKHPLEDWQSLIDAMRGEPAHPSALGA